MRNLFNYSNWSKLIESDADYGQFLEQKRNVLFSQFCIIGAISATVQAIYDLSDGFPIVALLDLLFVAILLIGYYLNERRKHIFAKMLVIISVNFMLFSMAAVVPREVGIFLLFYPLVAFSFITINPQYRSSSYFAAILSLSLNTILLFTKYHPYGNININPSDPTISFALNLLISIVLLSLGIDYLLKINHAAEGRLVESQQHTERLASEINEKNLILEKTNQELDRFVYSTSHDLRAPLASLLGLINLAELEGDRLTSDMKQYLAMMKDRVSNLDDFIQEIIDYSKNSRVDIILTSVDLSELIKEVIQNNRFIENAKDIKFETKLDINKEVMLDKSRVFRILNNLVSNAIKYNDFKKKEPKVVITALIEAGWLKITVSDTGLGIHDKIKNNIFDMFFRGSEKGDGSGLGLYIAREMTEKLGGTLDFESKSGQGTIFMLKVPIQAA